MITKYLLALLVLCRLTSSWGQHFNATYGQPVVVLYETNPWLMVVGSDVPSFALYENGQIIYKQVSAKQVKYVEVTHDRTQTQAIIKTLGITDSLLNERPAIEASTSTDQPTNILLLNFGKVKQIQVYGFLRSPESEARAKTPKDFLTVYDHLIHFNDPAAKEWLPDTIEVMATAYSHSPEKPLKWNSAWNDLKSPTTVKRNDNLYSIYLTKSQFSDLLKLLKSMKEKQAIEINGEKYSLSYRLPFPNLR
jgi:hypothetical protein